MIQQPVGKLFWDNQYLERRIPSSDANVIAFPAMKHEIALTPMIGGEHTVADPSVSAPIDANL